MTALWKGIVVPQGDMRGLCDGEPCTIFRYQKTTLVNIAWQ